MTKKNVSNEELVLEMSNGNVFQDLGIENSEEELAKAQLAWEIEQLIKKKGLTQAKAAKIMGITQPKVSSLIHRKLEGFSLERLLHFLNTLGKDIDIIIRQKPSRKKQGVIVVYHEFQNKVSSR